MRYIEMHPTTVLNKLVERACAYLSSGRGRMMNDWDRYGPGALVERLSSQEREALKGLTSDHTRSYRQSEAYLAGELYRHAEEERQLQKRLKRQRNSND